MSELKKTLNTRGLTMIAVGACIGSGIFVTPANTIYLLPHQGYVLLAWAIGGCIAFLGALTFSELGARYPQNGGIYVYLKNAFGPLYGFLYGWITLFIVNTGALAALGFALAEYLTYFVKLSDAGKSVLAIIVIWGLTILNIFGVNVSQAFASLFTGLKLFAMLLIILVGMYFLPNSYETLTLDLSNHIPDNLIQNMLLAFVGVFWSTGGWHHATFVSGEAIEPQKTVPKAMLYATLIVTVFYLSIISAYMILLPSDIMGASNKVAGDAIASVFSQGGRLVSVAITISIFGTIGIYTMSAPRIYYAMAKDGIFFKFLAEVSEKYKTPHNAMLFQAAWATVLIFLWGSFIRIITFVTFMDITFMALASLTIFIFRKKNQEYKGFKLSFYPWIPLIYLFVTIAFVYNTLSSLNAESWVGVLILAMGIPAYYYFRNRNKSGSQQVT
jgi:basic amino acid/polyamine antiporter, APA family